MKKQRFVLMYDFLFEVGGLERLMSIHAGFLKRAGYEVLLLFGAINPDIVKHKTFEGLKLQEYTNLKKGKFSRVLAGVFGFNKLKQIIKPEDVIISYSFPVNYTVKNFKNRKIQYLNHFPNFLYLPLNEKFIWANNGIRKTALISSLIAGSIIKRIDNRLIKKNILIFENSNFTKKRLDSIYKIRGIVSYPPVSKDFKPSKDPEILKKYNVERFIFASGRIIPDKRVDWLLESFSLIKDNSLKLLISGQCEESYKKKLIDLTKKLDISSRVDFLGVIPKDDLIKLYSMAKVYAFPAPKEDFGMITAEAISCGTPCVVWADNSGPTEQVTPNINGYHARPYDIKDYTKKLEDGLKKNWDKKVMLKNFEKFSENYQERIFIQAVKKVIKS